MSVTYPADPLKPYGDRVEVNPNVEGANDEPFIPVYARTGKSARRSGGKIKTWMILTPVGIIVLAGLGAVALGGGEETTSPLAEPAVTAPVVPATPLPGPMASGLATAPVVQTAPAPAPDLRQATPVRRVVPAAAPARRATAPTSRAAAPTPVARAVIPAPATSPTPMLNMAPTTPAPAVPVPAPALAQPPAPIIVVAPLG